jgi:starch synthase
MPSKSEPCGLSQMIALRYGTVPVVRSVGGLKDTISDAGGKNGNGFNFQSYNAHDFLGAIRRALELYRSPEAWRSLVLRGMKCDFSWKVSAGEYLRLYKQLKA